MALPKQHQVQARYGKGFLSCGSSICIGLGGAGRRTACGHGKPSIGATICGGEAEFFAPANTSKQNGHLLIYYIVVYTILLYFVVYCCIILNIALYIHIS